MSLKWAALLGFEQSADKIYLRFFFFFSFLQVFKRISQDVVLRIE